MTGKLGVETPRQVISQQVLAGGQPRPQGAQRMMIIPRRSVIGGLYIGSALTLWGFRLRLVLCTPYGGAGLGRGASWSVPSRLVSASPQEELEK